MDGIGNSSTSSNSVFDKGLRKRWTALFGFTVVVIYFYVLMEWIFLVTKPSFMNVLAIYEKLFILMITPFIFVIVFCFAIYLFRIFSLFLRPRVFRESCLALARLVPSFLLASCVLLLIDNFTYTVFGFGIRKTDGTIRYFYAFLYLALLGFSYWYIWIIERQKAKGRVLRLSGAALPALSVLFVIFRFLSLAGGSIAQSAEIAPLKNSPNIIIISTDGLSADHLPMYGYYRNTTPFLQEFSKTALLFENAFTNAGNSGSSIASMMTGKLPTATRLIYPPDILRGKDAYQHLPAILRRLGYRSIDISIRHFVDPLDLNMRNSYDRANFREMREDKLVEYMTKYFGQDTAYFIDNTLERIESRLLHAYGISSMSDAYEEAVGDGQKKYHNDDERIEELLAFIGASPAPFFAHVHLMGTHGPRFSPKQRKYSSGQAQSASWMVNYYDDAILDFDQYMKKIVENMRGNAVLDNTIIVIHTDHGRLWKTLLRVPLIIRFPKGQYAGRFEQNAQYLDITPTLLDYLGIEKPDWMRGQSLLSSQISPHRRIITIRMKSKVAEVIDGLWQINQAKVKPPFFHLGFVGVIICHRWYELDLTKKVLRYSEIKGHTSPCKEGDSPGPEEIERFIVDHLKINQWDVSSLKLPLDKIYIKPAR